MDFTETTLTAERVAFLNGESKGDVLAWLTSPIIGRVEKEWDEE